MADFDSDTYDPAAEAWEASRRRAIERGAQQQYIPITSVYRARELTRLADPTHILEDAIELYGLERAITPADVEQLARAMGVVAERVRELIKAVVVAFDPLTTAFNELAKSMLPELQQALAAPPVTTGRYSFAAVCPRHGPTNAGTCLRCARSKPNRW